MEVIRLRNRVRCDEAELSKTEQLYALASSYLFNYSQPHFQPDCVYCYDYQSLLFCFNCQESHMYRNPALHSKFSVQKKAWDMDDGLDFKFYFCHLLAEWPMGSQRVGHNWATSLSLFTFMHWRKKWQPTPVFLPGESQGQGSLMSCHLWGRTESDTAEVT